MGNMSSFGACWRRKQRIHIPPPPQQPPPNRFIFAPTTPYTNSNPDHSRKYSSYYGFSPVTPLLYVEHQKAIIIHNHVHLIKETLKLEPDLENPTRVLISFTFDADVSGRITIVFFAKESEDCKLLATKEETLPSITFDFEKGLGQKFVQPSGTGVDLSLFEDSELLFSDVEKGLYPLAIKGEVVSGVGSGNAEITLVEYVKEEGEVDVRVLKQILWVNGLRYEMCEIYGCDDGAREECVLCLSEPRDIVVLPCRHMCMCSGCAKVTRFQSNLCPVCKHPAERLLEIGVSGNGNGDEQKLS